MIQIFDLLEKYRPQSAYIWEEHIKIGKFEEFILDKKLQAIKQGIASISDFTVSIDHVDAERVKINDGIYELYLKATQSLMTAEWFKNELSKQI